MTVLVIKQWSEDQWLTLRLQQQHYYCSYVRVTEAKPSTTSLHSYKSSDTLQGAHFAYGSHRDSLPSVRFAEISVCKLQHRWRSYTKEPGDSRNMIRKQ